MNLTDIPRRRAIRRGLAHLARPFRRRPAVRAASPAPAAVSGPLRAFRAAALWGLGILIATADGAAFSESYRGLFEWAEQHGLSGFWAAAFPLQVDLFIVVGELVLFIAMMDRWNRRDRTGAWAVALLGLAVSVAGNIGHVHAHDLQTRGTAAVPPVAAFGALWLGLGVLKRILRQRRERAAETARDVQQAAERDALAKTLSGLADAVRALADRPAPEPVQIPDHGALLGELLEAVRELAARPDGAPREPVPGDAEGAAAASYRATLLAGNPWPQRQLEIRWQLSRAQAARVREQVHAELGIFSEVPRLRRIGDDDLDEPSLNGSGPHA